MFNYKFEGANSEHTSPPVCTLLSVGQVGGFFYFFSPNLLKPVITFFFFSEDKTSLQVAHMHTSTLSRL